MNNENIMKAQNTIRVSIAEIILQIMNSVS